MSNRKGWAAGFLIGSDKWLTVSGSAYRTPVLYDDRTAAVVSGQRGDTVAHVTEVYHSGVTMGCAYAITDGSAERIEGRCDVCGSAGTDHDHDHGR